MSDNKQPTILVKKADGTKVRVTLDEFRKMKSRQQEVNNEQVIDIESNKIQDTNKSQVSNYKQIDQNDFQEKQEEIIPPITPALPEPVPAVTLVKDEPTLEKEKNDAPVAEENELATTTPVSDIFVNEAAANFEWNEKDNKSLLEEDTKEVEKLKQQGSAHVGGHDLEEHVKMPSVNLEDDLRNRAKSLIVSWKKGVRNEFQVLDYAKKDVNHGGLGLDEAQAQRFLQQIKDSKNNLDNLFDIVFEKKMQMSAPVPVVEKVVTEAKPQPILGMSPSPKIDFGEENNQAISKPFSHTPPQSLVYDVASPRSMQERTVGPKQEIAVFGLVDYRRLSKDPKK